MQGRTLPLPEGATGPFVIVTELHTFDVPTEWAPHTHPAHELVWVRRGTLTARVDDRLYTVSEGYGLWVPKGMVHAGRVTANVELYDAFFAPEHLARELDQPTLIAMTPVLESLLIYLSDSDLGPDPRMRAEAVISDVLVPAENQLALQLPEDRRVASIAEALLEDPADNRSLEEWAHELQLNARTITRAFRSTTGLSFAQWRRSVRIHRALSLLGEGYEVQDVSDLLGYAHSGTFIDAFRQVMGTTPGALASARRESVRKSS